MLVLEAEEPVERPEVVTSVFDDEILNSFLLDEGVVHPENLSKRRVTSITDLAVLLLEVASELEHYALPEWLVAISGLERVDEVV